MHATKAGLAYVSTARLTSNLKNAFVSKDYQRTAGNLSYHLSDSIQPYL
jgi:hypothetical protein